MQYIIKNKHQSIKVNNKGFTLIECLVALFIISVVLASASRAIALTNEDVKTSYLRQTANWVAENQMNQIRLNKVYPPVANTQNNVTVAGIQFIVKVSVMSTLNTYFRRVEIVVSSTQPSRTLVKLIGFVSQY